jgi:hypothetical protein
MSCYCLHLGVDDKTLLRAYRLEIEQLKAKLQSMEQQQQQQQLVHATPANEAENSDSSNGAPFIRLNVKRCLY